MKLNSSQPTIEIMSRFMTQFQSLRVYGGYFWVGEQTMDLPDADRAMARMPSDMLIVNKKVRGTRRGWKARMEGEFFSPVSPLSPTSPRCQESLVVRRGRVVASCRHKLVCIRRSCRGPYADLPRRRPRTWFSPLTPSSGGARIRVDPRFRGSVGAHWGRGLARVPPVGVGLGVRSHVLRRC